MTAGIRLPHTLQTQLVQASLDQPNPTPELKRVLNYVLRVLDHPLQTQATEKPRSVLEALK